MTRVDSIPAFHLHHNHSAKCASLLYSQLLIVRLVSKGWRLFFNTIPTLGRCDGRKFKILFDKYFGWIILMPTRDERVSAIDFHEVEGHKRQNNKTKCFWGWSWECLHILMANGQQGNSNKSWCFRIHSFIYRQISTFIRPSSLVSTQRREVKMTFCPYYWSGSKTIAS